MYKVALVVLVVLASMVAAHADLSLSTAPSDWVTVPAAATSGDGKVNVLWARVGSPFDNGDSEDYAVASVGIKDAEIIVGGNTEDLDLDELTFGVKYQVCKEDTPLSIFLYNIREGGTAVPGFVFDPQIEALPKLLTSVAGWYNDGWEAGFAAGWKLFPYTLAAVEYSTSNKLAYGLQAQSKSLNGRVMYLDEDQDWVVSVGGTIGF
jgi:hypothetical protein